MSIRSDVSGHLYDDVLPCLKYLTQDIGVRVAVLTNGNANLTSCTVLGEYVTLSLGKDNITIFSADIVIWLPARVVEVFFTHILYDNKKIA